MSQGSLTPRAIERPKSAESEPPKPVRAQVIRIPKFEISSPGQLKAMESLMASPMLRILNWYIDGGALMLDAVFDGFDEKLQVKLSLVFRV